jgi:hypothetical protein
MANLNKKTTTKQNNILTTLIIIIIIIIKVNCNVHVRNAQTITVSQDCMRRHEDGLLLSIAIDWHFDEAICLAVGGNLSMCSHAAVECLEKWELVQAG